MEQLAFADFVERGELDRHVRRTRQIYRRRRDRLVSALERGCPDVRLHGIAAGLHVLVELADGTDEDAVVAGCEQQGIRVYGARGYWGGRNGPPALLIGYGGIQESQIQQGVERLARVLARLRPRRGR